jgi:serine/threonine protein kinase
VRREESARESEECERERESERTYERKREKRGEKAREKHGETTREIEMTNENKIGNDLNKVLYANSLNNVNPSLSWQLRVSYDIARAMHYLHSLNPPITHRDLRSPNVLVCSLREEWSRMKRKQRRGISKRRI